MAKPAIKVRMLHVHYNTDSAPVYYEANKVSSYVIEDGMLIVHMIPFGNKHGLDIIPLSSIKRIAVEYTQANIEKDGVVRNERT